jgi:hypothetical protein
MTQANLATLAFDDAGELNLLAWAQALAEAVLGEDGSDTDAEMIDAESAAETGETYADWIGWEIGEDTDDEYADLIADAELGEAMGIELDFAVELEIG